MVMQLMWHDVLSLHSKHTHCNCYTLAWCPEEEQASSLDKLYNMKSVGEAASKCHTEQITNGPMCCVLGSVSM